MSVHAPVRTKLPAARRPGGKQHAVNASGTQEDGSLAGFFTCCGIEIVAHDWVEDGSKIVTCARCIKALRPEDRVMDGD